MKNQRPKQSAIMYQLMNYERNRKLLEQIPHIRYLDMAIVFYYWKKEDDVMEGAYLISKEQMKFWGYSLEDLERAAAYNTPRHLAVTFQPMEELVRELLGEEVVKLEGDEKPHIPMYILTNQEKLFGASVMLYPQVLWAVSQSLQDDLYVLPSSIHECIIVPLSVKCSQNELQEIVTDINATQVPEEEILSDRVFIYHKNGDYLGF